MDDKRKYHILFCAFAGSIMAQTGCTMDQAVERIAMLCAITEVKVFEPAEQLKKNA